MTPLTSAAEVLLATDHDPYARNTFRGAMVRGWSTDGATAWLGTDMLDPTTYLSALGDPGIVGELVGEVLDQLTYRQQVTLPRGAGARLPAWVGLAGTPWDFRWLDVAPDLQAGEELVAPVTDLQAVQALLDVASPDATVVPGHPRDRGWVGITGPDGLLAVACDTSTGDGVGHLSSIAVHPGSRGKGFGAAVTAALARRQLDAGADLVGLGMYADNVAARGLYDALGFHDDHRFTSGPLQVRGRW